MGDEFAFYPKQECQVVHAGCQVWMIRWKVLAPDPERFTVVELRIRIVAHSLVERPQIIEEGSIATLIWSEIDTQGPQNVCQFSAVSDQVQVSHYGTSAGLRTTVQGKTSRLGQPCGASYRLGITGEVSAGVLGSDAIVANREFSQRFVHEHP